MRLPYPPFQLADSTTPSAAATTGVPQRVMMSMPEWNRRSP